MFAPSVATEAALDALVLEARNARAGTQKTRRRQALWLIPGAIMAVGALTAGTVAVDQMTRIDVPIAVEYTTDTGVTVSCTAHIESSYFSPRFAEVTEYYKTADFTSSGLGQRIYDYALVLAGDKKSTPNVLPDSVLWLPGKEGAEGWEPQGGLSALTESMYDFIGLDVENELGLATGSGGGQLESDCTGQLH